PVSIGDLDELPEGVRIRQLANDEAMSCRLLAFPVQIDQLVTLIDDQMDFVPDLRFVEPHAFGLVEAHGPIFQSSYGFKPHQTRADLLDCRQKVLVWARRSVARITGKRQAPRPRNDRRHY